MSRAYLKLDAEIRKDALALYSRRQTISDELGRRVHGLPAESYPELSIEELSQLTRSLDRYMSGRSL